VRVFFFLSLPCSSEARFFEAVARRSASVSMGISDFMRRECDELAPSVERDWCFRADGVCLLPDRTMLLLLFEFECCRFSLASWTIPECVFKGEFCCDNEGRLFLLMHDLHGSLHAQELLNAA